MNFFDKARLKLNKKYSDEEIDNFVQHLRANNRTIDTEEEALQFLHFQSNLDPAAARDDIVLDERLRMDETSGLYQLWLEYSEYSSKGNFDPLEFMRENISDAHEKLKANFYRVNPPEEKFDEFDEYQTDLSEFLKYLNEYSGAVLKSTGCGRDITAEQIEKLKNLSLDGENASGDHLMKLLAEDSSLIMMGGFKDSAEFEKVLAEYLAGKSDGDKTEAAENAGEELSEEDNALPLVSFDERDADIQIRLSQDKVHAWLFIIPPGKQGREITTTAISKILADNGVVYGINTFLIDRIVKESMYFKILEVAKGNYPVNGTNGKVHELMSRESHKINLVEDEHGRVNNKELGLIKSVHSGEAIAEVDLPTNATDGVQVTGEAVKGIDGKYPEVPVGTNTVLSEDRKTIVSAIDGELYYSKGVFNVRKVLKIDHDVDLSVGNINFAGDLIINGNIREGFSVKCEGNMKIFGLAEASEISAGGNILIEKGVFGGSKGSVEAGGNLDCRYLENCRVNIKGNLRADQLLRCSVYAEGLVNITGNKGRIIGGSVMGGKGVKAGFIGTQSGMASRVEITAGMTSIYMKRRSEKTSELTEIDESIKKLNQNIGFLEEKSGTLNQFQKALLEKLKLQLKVRKFQKNSVLEAIEELNEKCRSNSNPVEIRCSQLRSALDINYDGFRYSVDKELNNFRVYKEGPKIIAKATGFEKVITDKA
jgi:uncharacterized protein (DUF342 family)